MSLTRTAKSWWGSTTPAVGPVGTATTWVIVNFGVEEAGRVAGFRHYVESGGFDGNNYGVLYDGDNGVVLAAASWRPLSTGVDHWHQVWIRPWVRLLTTSNYMLFCIYPGGHYFRTNTALVGPVTHHNITFTRSAQSTSLFPMGTALTWNTNANAIDILWVPDAAASD